MSIQASNLIRFTPGPHEPGDSEPVARFTLILSTLLNGQLRTVTTTGNPLAVTLTIAFTEAVLSWCERVRLIGVNPPGHAPLEIAHPSAWGEPCAYLGPEDDQPLYWCLDREYENDEDRGPSVEIHWPIDKDWRIPIAQWKPVENLYPFFDWPVPVIGFDPPLKPGETPGPQPSADIKAIIDAHNAIRRDLGIAEDLVFNPRLSGTVEKHVRWLLETYPQYLDGSQPPPDWDPHEGDPDGRFGPGERAWADGYPSEPGSSVGENLAFHQRTVEELMTSWVNSPPHYACLIDPKWRTMGAAFVPNPTNLSNPDAHLCGALFGEIVEDPLDAVTMELEALKSLRPPTGEGETEIGVQLPMRLIAMKDGSPLETEIAVYNYEKAPGFTGSGDRVMFKHSDEVDPQPPNNAVFYLDERTLIERLKDGSAGNDPEPGLYELWWRIYHGSGDMIYRLSCQGSQTDATYRDRRSGGIGGGFGTFLTSDCLAATVRLDPEPYPFVCLSGSSRYNVSAEGDYRALPAEIETGDRAWIGPEGEIVTWSSTGDTILIGGKSVRRRQIVATEHGRALATDQYPAMFTCLAACLWRDADGLLWLRAAMAIYSGSSTITGVRLREMALQVNRQWVTRNTVAAPFIEHTPTLRARPERASYSWSQDRTRLCCWADAILSDTTTPATMRPGAVWESVISDPENPALGDFIEVYRDPVPPDPVYSFTGGEYHSSGGSECSWNGQWNYWQQYAHEFSGECRVLVRARYIDNAVSVRVLKCTLSGSVQYSWASSNTRNGPPCDFMSSYRWPDPPQSAPYTYTESSTASGPRAGKGAFALHEYPVGEAESEQNRIYEGTLEDYSWDLSYSAGRTRTVTVWQSNIWFPNSPPPGNYAGFPSIEEMQRYPDSSYNNTNAATLAVNLWQIPATELPMAVDYGVSDAPGSAWNWDDAKLKHGGDDLAAFTLSTQARAVVAKNSSRVSFFGSLMPLMDLSPGQNGSQNLLIARGLVRYAMSLLRRGSIYTLHAAQSPDGAILAQFQVSTDPSIRACTGTLADEIADVHLDAIHLLGKGVCMAPIPRETP